MIRSLPVAVFAASALHLAAFPDEPKPVKVLARGDWPHLPVHAPAGIGTDGKHHLWAIRTPEQLAKRAGNGGLLTVPKALGVPAIDFAKHTLIVVEDGTQPMVGVSGGGPPSALYAVRIERVETDAAGKTLTVFWRLVPRGKDQPVLTRPLEAVLVPKFDGEVKFEKLRRADEPGKDPEFAGKDVPVVARAFWPDGWPPEAPRREWVVRSRAELIDPRLRAPEPVLERMREEAAARYAKALGVPAVDFEKQMVVGVSAGVQPAGSKVEVTKVEADAAGKTLTVSWRLVPPDGEADSVTHPAAVVLLDQCPGEVKFREEK